MALLKGIRVIDTSTVIAAPFCATLLADFGADVIKVEMPGSGDPFRQMGPFYQGRAMRWATMGRNKRSVTMDLRMAEGKDLFLKLIAKSDVLVENFRVGTLDKWGLDLATLRAANPRLVVARLTGYGQTGPYAAKAGFGTPLTAFSGMTYITGYKDRPPVSPPFSLLDYVAGLYLHAGIAMALYSRDVLGGPPEEIDVSLYESVFRMLEGVVADYDKNGKIRERTPGLEGGASPTGTFETKDNQWVVIVASTQRTWEYLAAAMGRNELIDDPLYRENKNRVANNESLLRIVTEWVGSLSYAELQRILDDAGTPCNKIYSIRDIFKDPHYAERNDIVEVPHPGFGAIKMPGIFPKFRENPGEIKWAGPELGEHNQDVFGSLLGLTEAEQKVLRQKGAI